MKVKKTKNTKAKKKSKGSKSEEPMVKVIKLHVQPENPRNGFFELDWNEDFVGLLGEAGYAGPTDEAIVDLWFNDLCRSIVLEQEIEGNNVPGTPNQ